jgi:hypothetical protein
MDVFLLQILQKANGLAPKNLMVTAFKMWDEKNTGFIEKER